jgi:dihydrodipicolinate synthase/N-acetylneuraminate lyase
MRPRALSAPAVAGDGRLVLAGVQGYNMPDIVRRGQEARAAGADGLLVVPIFDYRPYRHYSQDPAAVLDFFQTLEREVGLPMVIFQYPDASGVGYPIGVLEQLAELELVVGIKAGTASVTRYAQIWDRLHGKIAPELFGMLSYGAHGALVGIGAIATQLWADMVRLAVSGDVNAAREIFNSQCVPLMRGIFKNQVHRDATKNAAACKEALALLGQLQCTAIRKPGEPVTAERREAIRQSLKEARLI